MGNKWANVLRTPVLDEKFLNLYYEAYGIEERDSTFIVKGDLLSLPDFVSESQILTLEDLLNKCYTIKEDNDLYDTYMEMKMYFEKMVKEVIELIK